MLEVLAIGAYAGGRPTNSTCYINFARDSRYKIKQVDGLDFPEGTIKMSQYVGLDGANFDSASVGFRTITLTIAIEKDAPSARHSIYDVFQQKSRVILYFASGSDRYCHIDGYVRSCDMSLFDKKQTAQVVIDCPSAYLSAGGYIPHTADAPTLGGMTYDGTNEAMYLQPTSDDHWSTGAGSTPAKYLIQNNGEVSVGAFITLTIVQNQTYNIEVHCQSVRTGVTKTMSFLNHYYAQYDELSILTIPNRKNITYYPNGSSTTRNGMGMLSPASEWFMLEKGDNYFWVTTDGADNNLFFDVSANGLYGGI